MSLRQEYEPDDVRPDQVNERRLFDAVTGGDVNAVKELLKINSLNINVRYTNGNTALMLSGNLEITRLLLADPRIDVNAQSNNGNTALHVAATSDDIEAVRLIIENPKSDVNIKNEIGDTPLTLAQMSESDDIVELLLGVPGIEVDDDSVGEILNQRLIKAAEMGEFGLIRDVLLPSDKININFEDGESKQTALMIAAKLNHLNVVKVLLDDPRINVNAKSSRSGSTALMFSVLPPNGIGIAAELLTHPDIKPNLLNKNNYSALLIGVLKDNTEAVEALVLDGPRTDINIDGGSHGGGLKAIHAVKSTGMLGLLMRSDHINVNALDGDYYTPLMAFVSKGDVEKVELLAYDLRTDMNYETTGTGTSVFSLLEPDSFFIEREIPDETMEAIRAIIYEASGESASGSGGDDYRKDVYEFDPGSFEDGGGGGDEVGKNYLSELSKLIKMIYSKRYGGDGGGSPFTPGGELPFEFKIKGQIGMDYSGVFRQVTSDFIDYWFPTHTVKLTSTDREPLYTFRFPRLSAVPTTTATATSDDDDDDEDEPIMIFGNVLALLAELVRLGPKIHNTPLNLSLDVVLDEIFMGSGVYDEDVVSKRPPIHRFYDNLSCGDETKLVDRFSANVLVKSGNWKNYAFVETFGNIITSACNQFDEGLNKLLDDFVAGDSKSREKKALLALTLYSKACPYIFDEDDLKNIDGLGETPLPEDIDTVIGDILDSSFNLTEQEYLDLWVKLYTRFLTSDERVRTFAFGLRLYATPPPPRALLTASLRGDGLDDSNIREAVLAKLAFVTSMSQALTSEQKRKGTAAFAAYLDSTDYVGVRRLLKFWTASTQLKGVLKVDVINARVSFGDIRAGRGPLPVAHTCFNTLDVDKSLIFVPGFVEQFKRKLGQATSVTEIALA